MFFNMRIKPKTMITQFGLVERLDGQTDHQ